MIRDFKNRVPDLTGESVLITGGSGSFGNAIVRLLLKEHSARRVIVFSRDELKQSEMAQELSFERYPAVRYFIGDVRDVSRLELAMRGVDIVIHAAALKQVPTAEYNPMECIHTNVLGAENVVQAAFRTGVRRVIALSTDKAANPINLYGASKLASDKIFVAANNLSTAMGTKFSIVRYGNVLGSRGSVVPFFRRLSSENVDHLPITDPRMTRFWITIRQGVDFVLSCLEMMEGGEVFVPRIPSMRVSQLAEVLAPGIPHRVIGIRPGEKLHEILITSDDARNTVVRDDHYIITPAFHFWDLEQVSVAGAKPVAEDFLYSSDTNQEWLSADDLLTLLADEDR